jgi:Tfp pilus assembly protein PilO
VKKYFEQLRPMERRLVVGVLVVLLIVLNAVFIWPHFSDWDKLHGRLDQAHDKLKLYQTAVTQIPSLKADLSKYESQGESVAPEDQGMNFMRAIQTQSTQSGVQLLNTSRQLTRTSDAFFVEQVQNINVLATEEQLVDFLYKLGSGVSMIRVRDLTLQPDLPHQKLIADIRLVASYKKNSASAANSSTAKAP